MPSSRFHNELPPVILDLYFRTYMVLELNISGPVVAALDFAFMNLEMTTLFRYFMTRIGCTFQNNYGAFVMPWGSHTLCVNHYSGYLSVELLATDVLYEFKLGFPDLRGAMDNWITYLLTLGSPPLPSK